MRNMLYIIAALFALSMLVELVLSSMKKRVVNQLIALLMNKDYEAFNKLINGKKTKFFVPVFNSLMLRFHKAIALDDKDELESILHKLHNIKKDKHQKTFFYSKAFSYYIAKKDQKHVEMYYRLITKCEESEAKSYVEMVYDTVIQSGFRYIEDAKLLLEKGNDEDKQNILLLIANMYENKGDSVHAKDYMTLFQNRFSRGGNL